MDKRTLSSPDKRGYRTCGVLVRQLSGYPTNRDLALFGGYHFSTKLDVQVFPTEGKSATLSR
jgi:hypothetical protein